MKIENNGISPLSTNRPEATNRVDKENTQFDSNPIHGRQDKAEMSKNARLLANARLELIKTDDVESDRLIMLRQKIESGDYTIPVSDLAHKILDKYFQK